jgi:nickel-dependent lactate racemase
VKSEPLASVVGAVTVPWGCWDPEATLELPFPSRFSVQVNGMRDGPRLSTATLADAVRQPWDSKPLREMAAHARTAVIAVDDITRPTPARDVLPILLSELHGIASENIKILVALGAHRPMVRAELEKKVGAAVLETIDVDQHHPYENLVDLGTSSRGTPIWLNRSFCEADLKIALGGVMPHPYMGFGGGAKLVVPGLAGIETLQANHQPAVTGISGGLADPNVDARRDVEEIALKAGLDFSCNIVVNSRREVAGLFCGHPVSAHRAAARFATDIYATAAPDAPYDVVCLNAYPKDGELLQVGNALNCYRTSSQPLLKRGGTLVITACCQLGRGYHSLHGRGMRLHRAPAPKPYLEGREIVFYSPHVNERDFRVSFAPEYRLFTVWEALSAYLQSKHPGAVSVGVFPTAPLQILS